MVAKKKPLSDFAVCVPLIPQELPEALLSHEWWDREALPSRIEDESRFDLVYVLPEGKCEDFEEAVKNSFQEHRLGRFFAQVRFAYAELEPEKNFYIRESDARPVNEFGLRAGPNHQFFFMFEEVGFNYTGILQMEVDCIAIRSGWLDRLVGELEAHPDAWVVGSQYHGPSLPFPLTDHLNGNAIYRSGSKNLQDFYFEIWKRRTIEIVKYQRPEMAFDCAVFEYFESDQSKEDYENRFVVSDYIANMAPTLSYPRWKHSIRELSEDMPDTCIVHASWLLEEVKDKLGFNEADWERVFPSREVDWSKVRWIWIKGFRKSKDARFDGGSFSIESNRNKISWRLGSEVLPQIEIEIDEGELTVEVHRIKRSRLAWLKEWLRALEMSGVVGKNLILDFAMMARSLNLEADFERFLISVTRLQFPGKKILALLVKIPASLMIKPLFQLTLKGVIKSFLNRNRLCQHNLEEGQHVVDLSVFQDGLDTEKHDLRLLFKNRSSRAVGGRMDFQVE